MKLLPLLLLLLVSLALAVSGYHVETFSQSTDGQEVLGHPAHRDDGLLPPLLALAPQHQPGAPGAKMDYLCSSQTDHLNSQYIQDSSLDYNITEY